MTGIEARQLEIALRQRYPDGSATVTPEADGAGAEIVIEGGGATHRYRVGGDGSALINLLVTGSPV